MKLCRGRLGTPFNESLTETLVKLFDSPKSLAPKTVIETGTYLGLGTTASLIDAVKASKQWKKGNSVHIHTIEANYNNYMKAKQNLSEYEIWVHLYHGLSLDLGECLNFIENDDVLLNHENYPDIYFDSPDPVQFYSDEVKGQLKAFGEGPQGKDGIMYSLALDNSKKNPLFVLDSAGGMGFLEYQRVIGMMGENIFYIWLHDVDHLKHFRSVLHMKDYLDCTMLVSHGTEWVLAGFNLWRAKDNSPLLPKVPRMEKVSITYKNRTMLLSEWAKELGVKKSQVYRRYKAGWHPERIIGIPYE